MQDTIVKHNNLKNVRTICSQLEKRLHAIQCFYARFQTRSRTALMFESMVSHTSIFYTYARHARTCSHFKQAFILYSGGNPQVQKTRILDDFIYLYTREAARDFCFVHAL